MRLHTTIAVNPDRTISLKGVPADNLKHNIRYNKKHNPERMLLIDGKCRHIGIGFTADDVTAYEKQYASKSRVI